MTSANAVADAALARATDYSSAWTTIGAAANSAAASVASLKNNAACTSQSSVADSDVNATLEQTQQASSDVSTTQALANQVKQEAAQGASPALTTDMQVLATLIPQASVDSARADAVATGGATANPNGSLTVSGGTLRDRMELIARHAQDLNSVSCAPPDNMRRFLTTSFIMLALLMSTAGAAPAAHADCLPGTEGCDNTGEVAPATLISDYAPGGTTFEAAKATPSPAPGTGGKPADPDDGYNSIMMKIMGLFAWLVGAAMLTLNYAVYFTVVTMGTYVKKSGGGWCHMGDSA